MRRLEQVKITDWAVRTLVVLTFFAYFVAPGRWMFPLGLFCSGAVGLWAGGPSYREAKGGDAARGNVQPSQRTHPRLA
jgi:hypothetical protein